MEKERGGAWRMAVIAQRLPENAKRRSRGGKMTNLTVIMAMARREIRKKREHHNSLLHDMLQKDVYRELCGDIENDIKRLDEADEILKNMFAPDAAVNAIDSFGR
jgi:hypothetical protein